jgi:hypothetical protein
MELVSPADKVLKPKVRTSDRGLSSRTRDKEPHQNAQEARQGGRVERNQLTSARRGVIFTTVYNR